MSPSKKNLPLLNANVSAFFYILGIVVAFLGRKVFIETLGSEYLGLSGLFTSMIYMLSLTELGVGTSIIYALYKPLATGDHAQVKALMKLFQKIYMYIGITVGIIGTIIIPFLPFITKNIDLDTDVKFYFILFLINSVVSYFFTYNRSLLSADQRNYIIVIVDFVIFRVLVFIIQIVILLTIHSFATYIIIQILGTVSANLCLTYIVKKKYSYLNKLESTNIHPQVINNIKKNTIGNVLSKLAAVIVTSTDNMLIAAFVNINAVGLLVNYTLITESLWSFVRQIFDSITGSIGIHGITSNYEERWKVYKRVLFVAFSLVYVLGVGLIVCINPFISIWIGNKYLLPGLTVLLIIANMLMKIYRITNLKFIDAYGLAWHLKAKPIVEIILNIFLSFLFLAKFKLGINGVLLGNIISSVATVLWWEAYGVYRWALNQSFKKFLTLTFQHSVILLIGCGSAYFISSFISLEGFYALILKGLAGEAVAIIIFHMVFRKNEDWIFMRNIGGNAFRGMKKRLNLH
jgi:O-antigen/teichoic acid export membrane protein